MIMVPKIHSVASWIDVTWFRGKFLIKIIRKFKVSTGGFVGTPWGILWDVPCVLPWGILWEVLWGSSGGASG